MTSVDIDSTTPGPDPTTFFLISFPCLGPVRGTFCLFVWSVGLFDSCFYPGLLLNDSSF